MCNTFNRFILLFAFALLAGCTGIPDGVKPVNGFKIDRYLGTWYEIVRLDHSFERGLTGVTANYRTRQDGGIDVLNRGYDTQKGSWREANGIAYFLGSPDIASLKVSFFGPFYGGYHVMALDPDYRWTMISGPSHDYFWILSRTPELPAEELEQLLQIARDAGFNLDDLIRVTHHVEQSSGK